MEPLEADYNQGRDGSWQHLARFMAGWKRLTSVKKQGFTASGVKVVFFAPEASDTSIGFHFHWAKPHVCPGDQSSLTFHKH